MSHEDAPDDDGARDPRALLLSPDAPPPAPWYRRRAGLVAVGVAAILAVTVLTDLPTTQSRSANISGAAAFVKEVNGDLAPCALGVRQAAALRLAQLRHTLDATDRSNAPSFLTQIENGCTAASPDIDDLLNIDEPGTSAHTSLADLLYFSTQWATNDALEMVEEVQLLVVDPTNAKDLRGLATALAAMRADRASANRQLEAADATLGTTLAAIDLPSISLPTAT